MSRENTSEGGEPQAAGHAHQKTASGAARTSNGHSSRQANGHREASVTPEGGGSPGGGAVGGARPKVRPAGPRPSSPVGLPLSERRHGSSGTDLAGQGGPGSDSHDDSLVYRYKGGVSSEGGSCRADLPQSFYNLDVGSDSEAGSYTASLPGVPGAGQSNLSTELAALIQSEMAMEAEAARARGRRPAPNPSHWALNGRRSASPELMDFLEMDFEGGSQSDLESQDSGQGGTETNSLQDALLYDPESFEPGESQREWLPGPDPAHRVGPGLPRLDRVPDNLPLSGARPTASAVHGASHGSGVTSVPAVTPILEELSLMVRSTSLNSPLAQALRPVSSGSASAPLANCLGSLQTDTGSLPIIRGPGQTDSSTVNRAVCGAKLLQRETLIFGEPHPARAASATTPVLVASPQLVQRVDHQPLTKRVMIWTESEACKRQVTQVGVSACGATSLINVLLAVNQPHEVSDVLASIRTRLRAESESLPKYIFSRASAGATHEDLIQAMESVSQSQISSRFFHMFPPRRLSLGAWLSGWIEKGAVPVATLNLQRGVLPGQTIPDAWHHQMVFGVGPKGVYLANPLDCVSEALLMDQLASPSMLLVRRHDIVTRYDDTCDLSLLAKHEHEVWDWFNVLGQVVNVLREHQSFLRDPQSQRELTPHIRIPAAYKSGVTLFMPQTSEHASELLNAPELELLQTNLK